MIHVCYYLYYVFPYNYVMYDVENRVNEITKYIVINGVLVIRLNAPQCCAWQTEKTPPPKTPKTKTSTTTTTTMNMFINAQTQWNTGG